MYFISSTLRFLKEITPCTFPYPQNIGDESMTKPECFTKEGMTKVVQVLSIFALSLLGGIMAMQALDQMLGKDSKQDERGIRKHGGNNNNHDDSAEMSPQKDEGKNSSKSTIENVHVKKTSKKYRVEKEING